MRPLPEAHSHQPITSKYPPPGILSVFSFCRILEINTLYGNIVEGRVLQNYSDVPILQ